MSALTGAAPLPKRPRGPRLLLPLVALAVASAGCARHAGARSAREPLGRPPGIEATGDAGFRADGSADRRAIARAAGGDAPPSSRAFDALPVPGDASHRLALRAGAVSVSIRLMEGRSEVVLSSRGPLRFHVREDVDKLVEGPPGAVWRVRRIAGTPAALDARVVVAELPFGDREGFSALVDEWAAHDVPLRAETVGSVYGLAGKVVDNRRTLALVDRPAAPPEALGALQEDLLKRFQTRTSLREHLRAEGRLTVELVDAGGAVVARTSAPITVEARGAEPIEVRGVEHDVGYEAHGFEDRTFRGRLRLTADRFGTMAVVNVVDLEDLLRGLVPAEIYATAHEEALKAQAVTARGEILAKVGLKHLADPYMLCAEQHCAVYRGVSGEAPGTNRAVEATRGEVLVTEAGRLVDSVYSAVCGGHSEHNEVVWGGVPNASLRGRPDVLPPFGPPALPSELARFLDTPGPYACRVSSFAKATKFRWEKRLTASEVDAAVARVARVGRVMALQVMERGVSGRARLLGVSGDAGATTVRGELTIRRLFGNLNSAMFEVSAVRDAKGAPRQWVFRGGGWGHGVGLCQTGAIGRAEAGQTYREILGHYFSGATVERLGGASGGPAETEAP